MPVDRLRRRLVGQFKTLRVHERQFLIFLNFLDNEIDDFRPTSNPILIFDSSLQVFYILLNLTPIFLLNQRTGYQNMYPFRNGVRSAAGGEAPLLILLKVGWEGNYLVETPIAFIWWYSLRTELLSWITYGLEMLLI